MATYIGPNGEVDAVQLTEDTTYPSGYVGKRGEWFISDVDGLNRLCDPAAFTQYKQKYPRPVGCERDDPPAASPPTTTSVA